MIIDSISKQSGALLTAIVNIDLSPLVGPLLFSASAYFISRIWFSSSSGGVSSEKGGSTSSGSDSANDSRLSTRTSSDSSLSEIVVNNSDECSAIFNDQSKDLSVRLDQNTLDSVINPVKENVVTSITEQLGGTSFVDPIELSNKVILEFIMEVKGLISSFITNIYNESDPLFIFRDLTSSFRNSLEILNIIFEKMKWSTSLFDSLEFLNKTPEVSDLVLKLNNKFFVLVLTLLSYAQGLLAIHLKDASFKSLALAFIGFFHQSSFLGIKVKNVYESVFPVETFHPSFVQENTQVFFKKYLQSIYDCGFFNETFYISSRDWVEIAYCSAHVLNDLVMDFFTELSLFHNLLSSVNCVL